MLLKKDIQIKKNGINTKDTRTILQYDLDGNFIKEWHSIRHAGRSLNILASNIWAVCNGNRKTMGGFVFKYK